MPFAEVAQPFVCAGISACFASSIIHPIDLAKVRLQLFSVLNPGVPRPPFFNIIINMIKKDGVKSVYAGLSASLMRQAIYGTARLGLFRTFSDNLEKKKNWWKSTILFKNNSRYEFWCNSSMYWNTI